MGKTPLIKKRSKKAGLPPGTLVHIGEQRTAAVKITVIEYDDTFYREKEIGSVDECSSLKDSPHVIWINVEGIHRIDVLEKLGSYFTIHPLTLEDILNTDQRPKIEDFGDYLYIVLKMFYYRDNKIITEQISLILRNNFVLSFQEGIEGDVFNPIRERLRNDKGRIRKMGADFLLYNLLDSLVDNYFLILEKLGEEIELLEEELITDPTNRTLHRIQHVKREMLFLRKSVWPLREVLSSLERGESPMVKGTTVIYLKDVYDHTIQVIDTIETFRDMVSGMMDIYLSSISNRLNAVMKVLTVITTIFMPLSFIAGVYGMNFRHMPELEWPFGYPLVLFIMFTIAVLMLIFFRKKRWL